MPLQTDLDIDPYWDDYDENKDFYKILFKPGVAVQTRELNQLQSILQKQIERFGDNIFKRGTIIDGVNVTLHPTLPFVKINDLETDGTQVAVDSYNKLYLKNSSNTIAFISQVESGFETQSPNLNTLFIKYTNSGNDSNSSTFQASDVLTVYDPEYPIFRYKVVDGSSSFSNNDAIVVTSAIAIQNSTSGNSFPVGAWNVNDIIFNGVANAVIVEANTTANTDWLILKVRPVSGDLATGNSTLWTFANGESITNQTTANTGRISGIIGLGAQGTITTDSLGKVASIAVANSGSGYYVPPYVSVSLSASSGAANADITQLDVQPLNYKTNISVANTAQTPIGVGYGVAVSEGVIYQKGYFSRLDPQLIVVNKYSNTGFTKSVGFHTEEEVVNSSQDTSLLDNSTGTPNSTAPGADRMKLTPVLRVLDKEDADANTEFLPIVEFADGAPYKSNKQTVYNIIGDAIAKRSFESNGNYVLDQYNLITKSSAVFAESNTIFKIVIDPGKAYINGYRLETTDNYSANVNKGFDTVNNPGATIRIGYGNYIKVKELAGIFQFNFGDIVNLYDTAKGYLTSTPGSAITPVGNLIGTARMRSLIHDSGEPGTPNAEFRLYLFDIVMSPGNNFASTKSVFYDGTTKDGIADTVLDGQLRTVLFDANLNALMFKSADAVKEANAVTYTYRTMDLSLAANTTGFIDVAAPGGTDNFPYADGALSTTAKRDLIVTSLGNYNGGANTSGNVQISTTNTTASGTGTTFTTSFKSGDFIKVANTTASAVVQVAQVLTNTSMVLTANSGTTINGNVVLHFPNNAPISLTNRPTRTVTKEANGHLTISLGTTIANATSLATASANVAVVYNVTANNSIPISKTVKREVYVRINAANNAGSFAGPWALGVSDVFRMRGVYKKIAGNANTVVTFDAAGSVNDTADFITITDNPFANGDSVIYDGNTAITGLTDGNTYFIVEANSSGVALSNTRGGAKLPIAPVGANTHSLSGKTFYFGPDTNGVVDITNEYYIDNNQKEAYLDTSYLYQKPRIADLGANDILLVKFDAYVTTTSGVKTVKSYPINDSLPLTSLSNSAVHTMELPEVVGNGGKYYDLRDQFDFRPVSANTIDYVSDFSNTAIINPIEPTDAIRFSAVEQKFPVPDTNLSANVTYYVGRNDRVVLDSRGSFTVVRGVAGIYAKYPPEPEDSLTLQILEIPPYPSLPSVLSDELAQIIDTGIANEQYVRRRDIYKITTPLDVADKTHIQTRNYTMSDIAALERRLKDLEYYVSFTLAETFAKTKFIGSSADSTIDRFKFGFFVDPFSGSSFSDDRNPEYYASIENGRLKPKILDFNIEMEYEESPGEIITVPYIEATMIDQRDATNGPVVPSSSLPENSSGNNAANTGTTPTPVVNATPIIVQKTSIVYESERNRYQRDNAPYVYDDFLYTFSTTAGPAELYMNHRDNNMATEIFQSVGRYGPWSTVTSSLAAQAITSSDIRFKGITSLNGGRTIEHPGSINRKGYGPVGGFVEDQHKLLWNHNPTNGIYYRVRVYKGEHHGGQGRSGTYGYKMFYPTDSESLANSIVIDPSNFGYIGIITKLDPPIFNITTKITDSTSPTPSQSWVSSDQKFIINVTGLKPDTSHKFMFSGIDYTANTTQIRTTTTNTTGLISDADGRLNLEFFYSGGITEYTTDYTYLNKLYSDISGMKIISIVNFDGTSFAIGSIGTKHYTTDTAISNTSTTSVLSASGSGNQMSLSDRHNINVV